MAVERIRIGRYRSLYDVDFRPRGFTVLVGPNNSGKTNLVEAVEFLADAYRYATELHQVERSAHRSRNNPSALAGARYARRMSSGEDRFASALGAALRPPWAMYRNVAWLEKRPGNEPADGEADVVLAHPDLGVMVIEVKGGGVRRIGGRWESIDRNGHVHQIKDPFAQVTRAMHRLKRVCGALPAWPAHDVRFTRAVCLPDAAYDRSMTPDGPREMVIDHADLADVGTRIQAIFDWWSRSGDASADGGAPGAMGMKALHELLGRDFEIASPLAAGVAADEATIVRLSERQFAVLDIVARSGGR